MVFSSARMPKTLLGLSWREIGVRKRVIDWMAESGDRVFADSEVLAKLALHFVGVNKDVMDKLILNS